MARQLQVPAHAGASELGFPVVLEEVAPGLLHKTEVGGVVLLIGAVSALVEVVPELAELDLDPVIVHRAGQGATCVDARLRLTPSASPHP